jgi:hypothetical protein
MNLTLSPRVLRVALVVLITLVGGAGVIALIQKQGSADDPPELTVAPPAIPNQASPAVTPVPPALKATIQDGVAPDMASLARSVPGVAAAARVLLTNLVLKAPSGEANVTVAAVDPEDFRPLTPPLTASADFVWQGLGESEAFIAHEQFQILGGQKISSVTTQAPAGTRAIRVGGLAANGVPNLAGALISMKEAAQLGLPSPKLLVVGLAQGAKVEDALAGLSKLFPGVTFERVNAEPGPKQQFFTGTSAQKAIGSFRFTSNPDGTITQDAQWVASHIVTRKVPILGAVQCHKVMIPQLTAALQEIQKTGLAGSIKQYGGCYVPRFQGSDRTKPLSMHAWGLAFDINVATNQQGARPQMDPRVVAIFEKWGFRWGGRWSPPDGNHFELAALVHG